MFVLKNNSNIISQYIQERNKVLILKVMNKYNYQ